MGKEKKPKKVEDLDIPNTFVNCLTCPEKEECEKFQNWLRSQDN
jgi:hypothetical protein